MSVLCKVRQIIDKDGVSGLLSRGVALTYRRGIRPLLPGHPVQYAGIPISHDRKWGDKFVPAAWLPDLSDQPDYEAALVQGLFEHVRDGDRVVVVGGGFGVTAVIAALRAGPIGHVECFEGSRKHVEHVRQTALRNGVGNLTVHHGVVAKSIAVYGASSGIGMIIAPARLPSCDVLELDCEGAEVQILRELTFRPRVILVETHGLYGAPTTLLASIMEERGYVVSDLGWAEPRDRDHCARNDIRVLLAINSVEQSSLKRYET